MENSSEHVPIEGLFTGTFLSHLCLKKYCKALWVKNQTGNTPPKIHNLVSILKAAGISFSVDQLDFMNVMNNFQIEGRYPDYQFKLQKMYKSKNTAEILKKVKQFSLWLQQQL